MLVSDLKDLPKLLKICRKFGVSSFHQTKDGGMAMTFGDMPKPGSPAHKAGLAGEAQGEDEGEEVQETRGLTDEELAEYSVRAPE